jgi:hypothetical protein
MATHDPEFYEAPKFSAEYDGSQPRQRGCFFYGCVIASVLFVLVLIALAAGAFFLYRVFNNAVEQWTSTAPMELPKVQVSEEDRRSVRERVDAFRKAVDAGTAIEPLVLTSDDLNALVEENPDFRGTIFTKIEGDKLKAQVSMPLDRLGIGMLRGRYLNGEAELKASLSNGILIVTMDSLEVNGKKPPENFMQSLRNQNLAKNAYDNPKNAELLSRFESLQIKDGKIILKPRSRSPGPPAATSAEKAKVPPAEADGDKSPEPAEEKGKRP